MANDTYTLSNSIVAKLKSQALFANIPEEDIKSSITNFEELHILKGEPVFRKGERYHKGIYFVINGTVSLENYDTHKQIYCENEPVGLSTFLGKTRYTSDAIATVDSDLVFVHEICIYNIMASFEHFRYKLTDDINARLASLSNSLAARKRTAFSTVASHMSSPVMTIQTNKTVIDAARLMADAHVESLLIVNRKQIIKGLITSSNIMNKFVCNVQENIDALEVERYGDTEPLFFPPELPINEAATELQIAGKSHAIVIQHGKPIGILSSNNIALKLYRNYNLFTTHIEGLKTIDELKVAYGNILNIASTLSTSARISRETLTTLSHIYYAIEKATFNITIDEVNKKHGFDITTQHHAYLVLGSAARREMNLQPYINHAIILHDNTDDKTYNQFVEFAKCFNKNLEMVGFRFDQLDDTDTSPDIGLIKRMSEWLEFIDNWSTKDGDYSGNSCFSCIMDIAIFDGDVASAWKLRNHLITKVINKPSTIRKILKLYPTIKIPISQFGSFITEKDGDYENMIDLHGNALSYLVNITRLLALHAGINDTSTISRIEHLARKGIVPEKMAANTIMAFDTILETLLSEQINQHENGQPITTYVTPSKMSLFYQEKLKRALQFLTIYTSHGMNHLMNL